MIILSLDTIGENCAVCLSKNNEILAFENLPLGKRHAEYILPMISKVCQAAKLELHSVKLISVNIGPGSFTGVRVGISVARALAVGLNCAVMGLNNFEILANDAHCQDKDIKDITTIVPASRGEFYLANFTFDYLNRYPTLQGEIQVINFDQVSKMLSNNKASGGDFIAEKIIIANFNQETNTDLKELLLDKTNILYQSNNYPIYHQAQLANLIPVAQRNEALPLYMREPDAKKQPMSNFLQ